MNERIDVLAVMDAGIASLMEGGGTLWTARDVSEMRAAVAELIELLDKAAGCVEAVANGTAQNIDPSFAENLARRMNEALPPPCRAGKCSGSGYYADRAEYGPCDCALPSNIARVGGAA